MDDTFLVLCTGSNIKLGVLVETPGEGAVIESEYLSWLIEALSIVPRSTYSSAQIFDFFFFELTRLPNGTAIL